MTFPIKDADAVDIETLGIALDDEGTFTLTIKGYSHRLTGEELLEEMRDQLDVRSSVRGALLRKAEKDILFGLKKGPERLDGEARAAFDLNVLIWFADKALKGAHQGYLAK
ncbi:MAG: hypothetical protein CMN55_13110 [Sneathiella sp.]|jgi:hypothetical protein|uniref:hypothetical protein n=1 Tax=Sneathiella sp. TaxID=1964365 RepID=UPI000C61CFF0|nr:hypothetical protein [Sneathiella sp.]MAL80029.1 hypothetical protein [Sneathiella sp.]